MAELADLGAIGMLSDWDQLVMMPADGAPARAQQLGTLARLTHERATAAEIGEWLAQIEGGELVRLGEIDRDIVRIARREGVPFATEVLVLDSGSRDSSADAARSRLFAITTVISSCAREYAQPAQTRS